MWRIEPGLIVIMMTLSTNHSGLNDDKGVEKSKENVPQGAAAYSNAELRLTPRKQRSNRRHA